jgi:hypothetical protein
MLPWKLFCQSSTDLKVSGKLRQQIDFKFVTFCVLKDIYKVKSF